jgi:hypothetical protein
MDQNFLKVRNDYLMKAWARGLAELAVCLPAAVAGESLVFQAFGERCVLSREDILLGGRSAAGPEGLLIALYASRVPEGAVQVEPLHAFKDLPHSMPYHGAFAANAEQILIPWVSQIQQQQEKILARFSGEINVTMVSGDFSFTVWPLPRVPLYYIFYLADEEFSAAVTCLFAASASRCLPVDVLADVAEYTGRRMVEMVRA